MNTNRKFGLSELDQVPLGPESLRMLDAASAAAGGNAMWRGRKLAEIQDLLALAQIAPWRLSVEYLDVGETLRAAVTLRVPVPCWPEGATDIVLADRVFLGLSYRQEALLAPQPGFAFVQILSEEPLVVRLIEDGDHGSRLDLPFLEKKRELFPGKGRPLPDQDGKHHERMIPIRFGVR